MFAKMTAKSSCIVYDFLEILSCRGDGVPVLQNLNQRISEFLALLVSDNEFLSSSALQLLNLYAIHKGRR